MNQRTRIAAIAGAGAGLTAAYFAYDLVYARPVAEANARLLAAKAGVTELEDKLRESKQVKKELAEFASRTLGRAPDTVSHRYTAGLRAVFERCGLGRVVVTHREAEKVLSPLTKLTGVRPEDLKKRLRANPDFQLLRGTVTGQGTLEQVTRAIAEVDAQAWCVIDSVELRPVGKEGEKFTVDLGVSAPLAPDLLDKEAPEPVLEVQKPESLWAVQAIVARNAFASGKKVAAAPPEVVKPADPPAPPAQPAPAPGSPLPPPPPPYAEWKLTGVIVGGRSGLQALFSNTRTNASVTVLKGAKVEDAVLVDGGGEMAVFEIGGARWRVRINQTLAERTPQQG